MNSFDLRNLTLAGYSSLLAPTLRTAVDDDSAEMTLSITVARNTMPFVAESDFRRSLRVDRTLEKSGKFNFRQNHWKGGHGYYLKV